MGAIVLRNQFGVNARNNGEGAVFGNFTDDRLAPQGSNFLNVSMPQGEGWKKFDWGGGQYNRSKIGIHVPSGSHGLEVGDQVQIQNADTNIPAVNGIHNVTGLGSDTGNAKNSMFIINIPKPEGTNVGEGYYRRVTTNGAEDSVSGDVTEKSGKSNTLKYVLIGGGAILFISIIAVIISKSRNK